MKTVPIPFEFNVFSKTQYYASAAPFIPNRFGFFTKIKHSFQV